MIKFVAKRVFSLKTWTQIVVIVFFLSAILRMYSGEDARNAAWDCVAKVGQQTQVVIDNVFEYFGYVPKEAKTENVVSGNAAPAAEANADKSNVNALPTTVPEGAVEEPKADSYEIAK